MGKGSPKDREGKAWKQKRRMRASSLNKKYLKPGELAQVRNNKELASKLCTDLGKKRVEVLDADKTNSEVMVDCVVESPKILSSVRLGGPLDRLRQISLQTSPKTPCAESCDFESRLESLPMDILVKILCHLHHDELRAVFHVSQRIRKAVILARQFHFNYTTPDHSRQRMLRAIARNRNGICISSPITPKAPRHALRVTSPIELSEKLPVVLSVTMHGPLTPIQITGFQSSFDLRGKVVPRNKLR